MKEEPSIPALKSNKDSKGRVQKKNVKKYGLLPNRGGGGGGGLRGWWKNQTAFLKKVFFREYLESF